MNFNFLKKKKERESFPSEVNAELPEDLERFRTRGMEPPSVTRENYAKPLEFIDEQPSRKMETQDKTDLILQKLETIDVRLKLLEEKLNV
jgi:hypothetical protein